MKTFWMISMLLLVQTLLWQMFACSPGCSKTQVIGESSQDSQKPKDKFTSSSSPPANTKQEDSPLVFLGDSLTAGYQLNLEDAFPALIQEALRKEGGLKGNIRVINAGVSGDTSAAAKARIPLILRLNPQLVFICIGANDALRGLPFSETKNHITQMVQDLKKSGRAVALAGIDVPGHFGDAYRKRFREIFVAVSESEKVPLMPFLLEGIALKKEYILPDGLHPNALGHTIIAKNVLSFLKTNHLLP